MLTAYDALMAREAEAGGADLLLVGDSLGAAVLGYDGVAQVTLMDMAYHTAAVVRGREKAAVIADMPFQTYRDSKEALASARTLMQTGCEAVKLEGCKPEIIRILVDAGIPVMGHLGYTPQSGPPQVVGRACESARRLLAEAHAVAAAGACSLVLELVPREVAAVVARKLKIPVIGIGSGPDVDGQVLVITDMWGESEADYKFLRCFGSVKNAKVAAVSAYAAAVRERVYPGDEHSFHMKKEELPSWKREFGV